MVLFHVSRSICHFLNLFRRPECCFFFRRLSTRMVAQAAPHHVLTRRFYPSIILPMQVPSLRDTAVQAWAAVPLLASSPTMKAARGQTHSHAAGGVSHCHSPPSSRDATLAFQRRHEPSRRHKDAANAHRTDVTLQKSRTSLLEPGQDPAAALPS